jgi:hypothetical protein
VYKDLLRWAQGLWNLPQYEGEVSAHSIVYVMDLKMEPLAFVIAGSRYLKRKYIAQFQTDGQSEM